MDDTRIMRLAESVAIAEYPRIQLKTTISNEGQSIQVWTVDGAYIRTFIDEEYSVSGKENVLIQRNGEISKVSLETLYHLFQEKRERLNVLSLNKEFLIWEWKPLRNAIKHKTIDPLMLIKTRCGREMRVTRSHSCLTVDDDGNIVKIAPKDMEIRRTFLPVMRGMFGESTSNWEIGKYIHKANKKPKSCRFHFGKMKLTSKLGFLIGIYLAEGCRNRCSGIPLGGINISAMNPDIRSKCAEIATGLGLHPNLNNPTSVVFNHKQLADAIGEEFGEGSLNKKIPAWVFGAPREFREGLIDGYWSGDGSITQTNSESWVCSAATDSKQLGQDVQALLASLGIASRVSYSKHKPKGFKNAHDEHWRIIVAGSHIGKMPKFTHGEKEEGRLKANVRETGSSHSSIAVVPLPRNLIGGRLRHRGRKNYATEELVLSAGNNEKLVSLAENLLWDAVVEIVPAEYEEFSYDLEIDENNTFVLANGIAVHNTNFGQHYRFPYIPENEFWLDRETTGDESSYFIEHLKVELSLMKQGSSYDQAIVEADRVEKTLRRKDNDIQNVIDPVTKMVDPRKFRVRLLKVLDNGVKVWLVNGRWVRSVLNIDFTQGGHEYVYSWIPENDVWIDNDIDWTERGFVILHELNERMKMENGMNYSDAHADSSALELSCRKQIDNLQESLASVGWA